MKTTFVAASFAAIMFAQSASAIEIYKDDKNAVAIGGWIDAQVLNIDDDTEVNNGSTRVNFSFTRQLPNDWKAFSKFEWALNIVGSSEAEYNGDDGLTTDSSEFLTNRLGYVGLAHKGYGSLAIGKQWGVWYDVVYNTNYLNWDGNASGTYTYNQGDGASNGTGRADKAVQYRNSIGNFSFALQTQLRQDTVITNAGETDNSSKFITDQSVQQLKFDYTYGLSATYQFNNDWVLTAGGNIGQFDVWSGDTSDSADWIKADHTDSIYGMGLSYGNWSGPGFYAALNLSQQENHDTDPVGRLIPKAVGLESLIAYQFDNHIQPLLAYNILKADDSYDDIYDGDSFQREFLVLGLQYVWTPNTVVYLEARKDLSDSVSENYQSYMDNDEQDAVALGIRYYL